MKRFAIIPMMLLLAWGLFGQNQAVIKEFSGKVEIQLPGRAWAPAVRGAVLPQGASVSTGFNSRATLDLGVSVVQVKPLTRMSVAELSRREGADVTTVDLRVGRVNAKVEKAEGLEHNFTLRTPVSTAAVRGTELDGAVGKADVKSGLVRMSNALGQTRTLGQGEKSSTTGKSAPQGGEEGKKKESSTSTNTVPVFVPPPKPPAPLSTGSIRVIIEEPIAE